MKKLEIHDIRCERAWLGNIDTQIEEKINEIIDCVNKLIDMHQPFYDNWEEIKKKDKNVIFQLNSGQVDKIVKEGKKCTTNKPKKGGKVS